jgi:hypothetical protein
MVMPGADDTPELSSLRVTTVKLLHGATMLWATTSPLAAGIGWLVAIPSSFSLSLMNVEKALALRQVVDTM